MTVINGTPGADTIDVPKTGDQEVYAGAGNDAIRLEKYGNQPGNVLIDAGDGDDTIQIEAYSEDSIVAHGGAGADTIVMVAGGLLYGDAGADVFQIGYAASSSWLATIADFSAEDRLDVLPLLTFSGSGWVYGSDPFAVGQARFLQVGADTLVQAKRYADDANWANYAIILNQDASKITSAQVGGFKPVVGPAPVLTSVSVAQGWVMEGGKLDVEVALSEPLTKATQVTVRATGAGDYVQEVTVTLQAGETKARVTVAVRDDAWSGVHGPAYITASSPDAMVDPHRSLSVAKIPVLDNDQNGFMVSRDSPVLAYRSLTQLDEIKASDQNAMGSFFLIGGTRDAVRVIEAFTLATTSVALTAYQFFTGKSPGQAGLKYLVNSPDNASDLNDANGIYAGMNTENRYINFAANLGLVGEGKAAFSDAYKGLTFRQAVDKAYDAVIGKAYAQSAGINVAAAIDGVVAASGYFDAVATQRMAGFDHDLAMKAGMIGYLIAEGQKAHVGVYARAVENFYIDYMDGVAQHNVDLVAVYGPGTFLDAI